MSSPRYDFVKGYSASGAVRLHMPGHKGHGTLGEQYDITEISGADSLYEAEGIIRESEAQASDIFGAHTFYSTEGSSLAIRAMLYLACLCAPSGARPLILAGRNAHKVFLSAAALLDFRVEWLYGGESYLSCKITAEDIERRLSSEKERPTALYLTSPDYLGGRVDIEGIAKACHAHGVLLLVDNAHGAYLKLLQSSEHPMDLGADMCSDSAHKTLPVLTGGAYLHVSKSAPEVCRIRAKSALALFGSTSPSYLILSSLDLVNDRIKGDYKDKMSIFIYKIAVLKRELENQGYELYGDEPAKITVRAKDYGYCGQELASLVEAEGIFCEFSDPDYLVLMLTPSTTDEEMERLLQAMRSIPKKEALAASAPAVCECKTALTPREAMLCNSETVSVDKSVGRILAAATVGCPPAVPIVMSGEIINENAALAMKYYGISKVLVVKNELLNQKN